MSASDRDDLIADLSRRARSAKLRYALLQQAVWWVPEVGWDKYCRASLGVLVVQELSAQAAGEVPVGAPRSTPFVTSAFDVLDAAAGEKIAIADMGNSWRRNTVQFLWRHTPRILDGLHWAPALNAGTFRVSGADYSDLDWAVEQEGYWCLELLNDQRKRRAWFDDLPLIAALRQHTVDELSARLPKAPVLLG